MKFTIKANPYSMPTQRLCIVLVSIYNTQYPGGATDRIEGTVTLNPALPPPPQGPKRHICTNGAHMSARGVKERIRLHVAS